MLGDGVGVCVERDLQGRGGAAGESAGGGELLGLCGVFERGVVDGRCGSERGAGAELRGDGRERVERVWVWAGAERGEREGGLWRDCL